MELLPRSGVSKMDHQSPGTFFNAHYEQITQEVEYKPAWCTEGGHFDYAQFDPVLKAMLPAGAVVRCLDEHNRKVIFVGTDWGLVVVFQRYSDDPESVVCHLPRKLAQNGMKFYGYLSLEELEVLLGSNTSPNIGNVN
jgi:hypothetical protein